MGNLSLFLKKNKKEKKNAFYAATKSLCDEKGEPVLWEIQPLNTTMTEKIRVDCTIDVPVTGKPGFYRPKVDSASYIVKLIVASVVTPDLMNAELQDSYGVRTPEDLVRQMVDDPLEYNELANFVQNFNGLGETFQEKVDQAKN